MSKNRGPYVGSMMRVVHDWVLEHAFAHVTAAGYRDLSYGLISIFRYPTPDGLRPSELADQLRVTKQSVNDVLRSLEAFGYLTLVRDVRDGRARIIRLTAKGKRLERVVYEGAESAANEIAGLLGPREFARLQGSLEKVIHSIADGQIASQRRYLIYAHSDKARQ